MAAEPGRPRAGRPAADPRVRFLALGWTAAAALSVVALTALIRLPLFGLPLDPDEGGYAYLARRWALGAPLYSDGAWVDRPPGLMTVFRWVGAVAYTPTALRVTAMLAAVVLALGAGAAGWALRGRRAGLVSAAVTGVVVAGPFVQGYELNGELLAAALAAWGLAIAFAWRGGRPATGWLVLAGALCGTALTMKQSAVDAPLVLLATTLPATTATTPSATILTPRSRHAVPDDGAVKIVGRSGRFGALGTAALGLALPIGTALVWAAVTGWHRFWYAVVGFQAGLSKGQTLAGRLSMLRESVAHVTPDLLGLALVAGFGAVAAWRVRERCWPALLWAAVALLAVVSGPFAHHHYWVQAVAPLAVLAGIGAASVSRRAAVALVAVAVVVPLATQGFLAVQSPARRTQLLVHDRRQLAAGDIAAWLRAHSAPGDRVYAFIASADLYLLAGRATGYPYLWYENVQQIPGAKDRLAAYLSGPDRPRYVVVYHRPKEVDPSGALGRVLDAAYVEVAKVDGYVILERRDVVPG